MPTASQLSYSYKFQYQQYLYQSIGGWCAAISEMIIKAVKTDNVSLPDDVSEVAKRVCNDSKQLDTAKALKKRQPAYDSFFAMAGTDWVYKFTDTGVAFLRLNVRSDVSVDKSAPGGDWAEWSEGTVNHSGVVAWKGSEAFVFDPNAGGATFRPRQPAQNASFAEDVDTILGQMYKDGDKLNGARSVNVVSIPKGYKQSWADWLAGGDYK